MKSLIKRSLAALPLSVRLATVNLAANGKWNAVLPVPRAAHSVACPQFRSWIRSHVHPRAAFFPDRTELYQFLCAQFAGQPIAYYDFGMHQGRSMRRWLECNTNADSRFYGFDEFEGQNNAQDFDDNRVRVIQGPFHETMPAHRGLFETSVPKIINLDADTYAPTMTVLQNIGSEIDRRGIVIFDEFCDLDHEFKALADYGRPYTVLAATSFFMQVAVRFSER